jgi:hypothetical protein
LERPNTLESASFDKSYRTRDSGTSALGSNVASLLDLGR